MFSLKDIIGDVVFLVFNDASMLSDVGVNVPSGHFLIKGQDSLGLWIQHPGIRIKHVEDESGKPLKPQEHYEEKIDGIFLVRWENIKTIMHYPNRPGYDFPSEFDKKIGFNDD